MTVTVCWNTTSDMGDWGLCFTRPAGRQRKNRRNAKKEKQRGRERGMERDRERERERARGG